MRFVKSLIPVIMVGMLVGCTGGSASAPPPQAGAPDGAISQDAGDQSAMSSQPREQGAFRGYVVRGTRGTYSGEPRIGHHKRGRIDVARLADELEAVGANTYNFLIKRSEHDWDDLQAFLPLARERGIKVWVTLTCPSKQKRMSMPYGHDYERWAEEIANLSVREPNLVAWGMDDFSHNEEFFTRDRMERILATASAINPELAFVPTVYYRKAMQRQYVRQYRGLFDAVLFPYRAESSGSKNLQDAERVQGEIADLREQFGDRVPIVLDVYASRHSQMGDSTPEYVEQVMQAGRRHADGVMVFRHQEPGTAKWEVVSTSFNE